MGVREEDAEIGVLLNCFFHVSSLQVQVQVSFSCDLEIDRVCHHEGRLNLLISVQCSEEATWKRNEQG